MAEEKQYYFYKVLRKTIIQFCDIFSDIQIGRYDVNGNLLKTVKVPLRFGPKTKQYLWFKEHGRDEEMLPMLSVDIQAIDFDPNRVANRRQEITVSKDLDTTTFYRNVTPYNVTFNMRLWALHMVDIDQIYEQILPYFAPHAFIRINIPEVDTTIEVKVILSSCSPEMTEDVGEEEARVLRWSTLFIAQTWMFRPVTDSALIHKIYTNYYTDAVPWADRDTSSLYLSAGTEGNQFQESQFLEGRGYDEDARLMYNYEIFPGDVS